MLHSRTETRNRTKNNEKFKRTGYGGRRSRNRKKTATDDRFTIRMECTAGPEPFKESHKPKSELSDMS